MSPRSDTTRAPADAPSAVILAAVALLGLGATMPSRAPAAVLVGLVLLLVAAVRTWARCALAELDRQLARVERPPSGRTGRRLRGVPSRS